MNTSKPKPALTIAASSASSRSGCSCSVSATSASAPATTRSPCRTAPGRRARSCSRVTTTPRTAATPPTAARSSCPRTAPIRSSRLIALPVTRIRARSAHPASRSSGLEGGPGITNMEFSKASRFAERPRRRPRRLPRRRRLRRGSTAPRSRRRCKHSTDFLSAKSHRAYADGFRACADAAAGRRRRPRRVHAAPAGRRPRGRAHGARLRAHRPAQRERRHAHGDDLRVAPPASVHRSVMLARQPARPLPLGREGRSDALDRPLLRALRAGRELQRADGRPRRVDAGGRRRTCPTTSLFLPIKKGNVRARVVLRPHGVDLRSRAAHGADDDRSPGSRLRRATRAASGSSPSPPGSSSRSRSSGATSRQPRGPTSAPRSGTSRRARIDADSILGDAGHRVHLGRRPHAPTRGPRNASDDQYSHGAQRRGCRRC